MYPGIPALSFIFSALTLVPLTWYLRARNVAAVAIGIWLSIANLVYTVDALVWADTADITASVWCDISTSFITGSRIALPAACLSICIHLERLAAFCQTSTPQAKRRRIIFECCMCFGLPLVYIALPYLIDLIVQPRRFDLFYGFGCRPVTYPTIAAIFLAMMPPLLLTIATILYAGMAWRHFLVHGVQFCGKRSSISSLTRNSYLRLVGMALLEATFSAILVAVVMWGIPFPGPGSTGSATRRLSEIRVWSPDVITNSVRIVLEIEWSVTAVQSAVFFGLFACRMEVVHEGRRQICSLGRMFRRPDPSAALETGTSEQSSTSHSVPTLPMTVVDLSLVIESASTLTQYGHLDKPLPSASSSSSFHCPIEDAPGGDVAVSVVPAVIPLESPSRVSAIASSHNSLESNLDPSQFVINPEEWPKTPTSIPVRPHRSVSVGGFSKLDLGWFDVDVPFSRSIPAVHVRSCVTDSPLERRSERRQAIRVMMVKEIQYEPPLPSSFFSPSLC